MDTKDSQPPAPPSYEDATSQSQPSPAPISMQPSALSSNPPAPASSVFAPIPSQPYPAYGAYGHGGNTVIVPNPYAVYAADRSLMGPYPAIVTCSHCLKETTTTTKTHANSAKWRAGFMMLPICCFCCFCCVAPWYMLKMASVHHFCSHCKQEVGVFKPPFQTTVSTNQPGTVQ